MTPAEIWNLRHRAATDRDAGTVTLCDIALTGGAVTSMFALEALPAVAARYAKHDAETVQVTVTNAERRLLRWVAGELWGCGMGRVIKILERLGGGEDDGVVDDDDGKAP